MSSLERTIRSSAHVLVQTAVLITAITANLNLVGIITLITWSIAMGLVLIAGSSKAAARA